MCEKHAVTNCSNRESTLLHCFVIFIAVVTSPKLETTDPNSICICICDVQTMNVHCVLSQDSTGVIRVNGLDRAS